MSNEVKNEGGAMEEIKEDRSGDPCILWTIFGLFFSQWFILFSP